MKVRGREQGVFGPRQVFWAAILGAASSGLCLAADAPGPDSKAPSKINSRVSKEIWKSRIGGPSSASNQVLRDSMDDLIRQVQRAVQTSGKPPYRAETPGTDRPVSGVPTASDANAPLAPEIPSTPSVAPPMTGAPQSKMPTALPQTVDQPFALAEVLYRSGRLKEAASFYREAMDKTPENYPQAASRRAWILFQWANCLRHEQPLEARRLYQQLIAEYPQSPWTSFAVAWQGLADWYFKDEPYKLLERCKSRIPTESAATPEP